MNYEKLTAGTTKTAIDTAKPSEKGEIITYLSRMGDVLGHMGDEKLQELLHAVIGELAVGIAPLTVVLVEAAVQIPADDLIAVQGHTTALTDQFARVTQQMIDGGIKQCGQLL